MTRQTNESRQTNDIASWLSDRLVLVPLSSFGLVPRASDRTCVCVCVCVGGKRFCEKRDWGSQDDTTRHEQHMYVPMKDHGSKFIILELQPHLVPKLQGGNQGFAVNQFHHVDLVVLAVVVEVVAVRW